MEDQHSRKSRQSESSDYWGSKNNIEDPNS
jgi:hypothetical protein